MPTKSSEVSIRLLKLERRLADLEFSLKKLKEEFESTGVSDFKQRFEDVEDLVAVENALMLELKKMMEEVKAESANVTDVRKKVEEMETALKLPSGVSEEMKSLKDRLVEVEKKLAAVPEKEEVNAFLNSFKSELENKIAAKKEPSYEKVDTLAKSVQLFEKRLKELDVVKTVESQKRLESLAQEVTNKVEEVNRLLAKVESQQIGMEKGTARISLTEEELKRTKKSMLDLLKRIEGFEDKVFELSKKYEESRIYLTEKIKSEVEAISTELNESMLQTKNELMELVEAKLSASRFAKALEEVQNKISALEEENKKEFDKINSMFKEFTETHVLPDERLNELMSRSLYLENKLAALEKMLREFTKFSPLVIE